MSMGENVIMDQIKIDNLQIFAHHGVYDFETENGQNFYVNAVLFTDLHSAGNSDSLEDSTSYAQVCEWLSAYLKNHTFQLLEAAAEHAVRELLLTFPLIHGVEFELRKPEAPIGLPFESVSIKISRGWHGVYLSFGSNLGEKEQHIRNGLEQLENNRLCRMKKVSDYIITKPYGGVEQEDFVNGACYLETLMEPQELLEELHRIEALEDRKREIHWGPRTLDLDILFYDKLVYDSTELVIPHVDMENREFVLEPMRQLAPDFRHPVNGLTIKQMLLHLKNKKEDN